MSSKFLLLFLGTFLLVQSSFGKALPSPEESTAKIDDTTLEPEISDVPESPSDKLFSYVVKEFSKVADATLKKGKQFLQDVVAELSALDDKNKDITTRLEEYSELVKEIEKVQTEGYSDEESENLLVLVQFIDLIDKSNLTLIEKPTNSDKLIEASLQKNGLSKLEQDSNDLFEEVFSKEFYEAFDEILNSTTTAEWPTKIKFHEWLKEFKAENVVERKTHVFVKFFDLFE